MIRLYIKDIPSSNNATQGKGGVKRALAYNEEKKVWSGYFQILRSQMSKELKGLPLPYSQATVIMIYHFPNGQRRDPDNYSGKMILDGLKDAGFIVDDAFRNVDIFPDSTFGNDKGAHLIERPMTEIWILQGKRISQDILPDLMEVDEICGVI
jgi:crossover junction endodeoxyribonuclease RusA